MRDGIGRSGYLVGRLACSLKFHHRVNSVRVDRLRWADVEREGSLDLG